MVKEVIIGALAICLWCTLPIVAQAAKEAVPPGVSREIISLQFSDIPLGMLKLSYPGDKPSSKWKHGAAVPLQGRIAVHKSVSYSLVLSNYGSEHPDLIKSIGPYIYELDLGKFPATDALAEKIFPATPNLVILHANDSEITDRGAQSIGALRCLEYLSIERSNITSNALAAFGRLSKLKVLFVTHNNLDDSGVFKLRTLHNLERLRLTSTRIGDSALPALAGLGNLQKLHLSKNDRITDAGVAYLRNLKDLRELNLSDTRVTQHCADSLKSLPKLNSLYISFRTIGPAGVAYMRATLPRVKIEEHGTDLPMEIFAPLHSPIAPQHFHADQ